MPCDSATTVAPPKNRKKKNSRMVAKAPRSARNCTPFSTPVVAEIRNIAVTSTMITTVISLVFGTPNRYCRPLLSCSPFRPSEVAVPNRVAMMASASMRRPIGLSCAFGPSTGVNVELTWIGVPLRKAK